MRAKSLLLVTMLVLAPSAVFAQSWIIEGADRYFRVEWQAGQGRRGPVLAGYVYNTYGQTADRVRLLIEGLDSGGRVTSTTTAYVLGTIPALDRGYFEAPAPPGAASYRVRVASYDLIGRGGQ